ncbi:uncharacterized protein F54H12.2 [Trichonephila clavipes]|nr:uncharacterized protein F54H12.2 [Trichonephila clavipes]
MSVPYVCCTKRFEDHYAGQIGSGLTHYKGINFQKGYGIGGIFRRLFRAALPFLVKGVDVSLNDRVVSNSSNTYPYRSYIETLLNHGYDSKTSQLTAELFYKDSDDGLKKRTEFFKESATVDMIGCIHLDLFHQDRLLLNLVDLKIKLIRSKPEFSLQGSEGFKVALDHVSLFIRKVRVNPGVILGHAKALEKTSAKYPINRVLCKVYSIPKGSMSFIQDNIFSDQMPKKLFVGCVDNEAFHGAFSKSPYEFKHFNLNFIGVYVDGQPVPHNPLELDFLKINTYGPIKLYLLGQIEWVKTEVYLFLEKNIKIQIHCLDLTSHRIYVLQENI